MHFVVVGAGGLGCPALLGLSMGDAPITIVDPDVVERSNLQRQVLYGLADVGRNKAEAARDALLRRRPRLTVEARVQGLHPAELDPFLDDLPADALLLECTDQPALKFALNDACIARRIPLVVGAALGWRGQVMAVAAGHACYRCIYEDPPPNVASCEAAGVLGPAVGVAGWLMAAVALRLAADTDETAGQLMAIDSGTGQVQTLAPRARPGCPNH